MDKMEICIIAHGSRSIGMGHVMRTLTLAESLRDCGAGVFFCSKYEEGIHAIKQRGFAVKKMQSTPVEEKGFFYGAPKELDNDLQELGEILSRRKADIIVLDSYNISAEFFVQLKKLAGCLVYIDDLNLFDYPADILINGTAAARELGYCTLSKAKMLLGLKYNLLRKEFWGMPAKNVRKTVCDIMITTGSSDPHHMTERLLKYIMGLSCVQKINVHAIIGAGFGIPSTDKGQFQLGGNYSIKFYQNPTAMSAIMKRCDIAITAGGSTLYELAACGIPMMAFIYAKNQEAQVLSLEKSGLLINLGSYSELQYKDFRDKINELMMDYELRAEMSVKLQALVDGKGGQRAAEKIMAHFQMMDKERQQ